MNGLAGVLERITAIEARLRTVGVGATGPTGGAGPSGAAAGQSFAAAIAAAGAAQGGLSAVDAGAAEAWGPVPNAPVAGWATSGLAGLFSGASGLGSVGGASALGASAFTLAGSTVDPALRVVSPLDGRLSQPFGPTDSVYSAPATVNGVHYHHFHDGCDIAAPMGSPIRSMAAGEVVFAGTHPDGAVVVRVRHADGSEALYAHLAPGLEVRAGDRVAAGQQLGSVGMTGNTTGPHLHLELTYRGEKLDPQVSLRAGTLPGALSGAAATTFAGSLAAAGATGTAAVTTLARFDAVAHRIPFAAEIRSAALEAGIDPLLLASMVRHESGFRPDAVSSAGAMGLTQLMPATARYLGVADPFDPAENLRGGARYLATQLRSHGRVDLALAAYQAGPGAVAVAGGIPDSATTHAYIDRILGSWAGYLEATA